jgi:hypothetical protein
MKIVFLCFILSSPVWGSSDLPKVHQIDYRSRLTLTTKIPGIAELAIKTSKEIRFRTQKVKKSNSSSSR